MTTTYAYVGGFAMPSGPDGDGLTVFRVDGRTGAFEPVWSGFPGLNVGSTAFDADRAVLYLTEEVVSTADYRARTGASGGGGGRVHALRIDPTTGVPTAISESPSFGTLPAGIALDPASRSLVVVHFTARTAVTTVIGNRTDGYDVRVVHEDATAVLFPLAEDGSIGAPDDVCVQPAHPHGPSCLHSVTRSPDGSSFVVCDMERDQVVTWSIDRSSRTLRRMATFQAPEGSEPRYSVFHDRLPVFFVNYERSPVIEAFAHRPDGAIESIGVVEVLPAGTAHRADALQSGLGLHPSGRFLYTLVRGHEVVSVFRVDPASGLPERIQTVALGAANLKGCTVSPDGNHLYVAASKSDTVLRLAIAEDGTVAPTEDVVVVPRPGSISLVSF